MYGIRDHEIFSSPLSVEVETTVKKTAPSSFEEVAEAGEVALVPLVTNTGKSYSAGWCSYEPQLSESPDIEIVCGGLNSKTPSAAAIWRQGHLLHFGFEVPPSAMNETGKALLINSIHYISRFTDDRALLRVGSVFAGAALSPPSRLRAYLTRYEQPDWYRPRIVIDELREVGNGVDDLLKWHDENAPYFQGTDAGLWQVDLDARRLQLDVTSDTLVATALHHAADATDWKAAATVLARAIPDGPGVRAAAEDWSKWYDRHQDALFFSEFGGYRWYVDTLALQRGVPTAELRGARRGTPRIDAGLRGTR